MNRTTIRQLISFGINGIATALVYSVAVWSLIALSRDTFVLDVVIAYVIATIFNYLGARLVFRPAAGPSGHVFRYLVVVAGNFGTAALLAWILHREDVPDGVAAYLPVAVTAVPTFVLMRLWVFTPSPAPVN